MPIKTTSYTTTGKNQVGAQSIMIVSNEIKLGAQGNESSAAKYSSLITNGSTNSQNINQLGINGLAVSNLKQMEIQK